jgi:hypothetical protein
MAKPKDNTSIPGSSKQKKSISAIYFKGDRTIVHFTQTFQPQGQNDVVKEQPIFKSDLGRHADFERARDKFKTHFILSALPFVKPDDITGKLIDKEWFDQHLYETHPSFMDVEVLGIVVTTKTDQTSFYVIGEITNQFDQKTKFKGNVINLVHQEGGENYALRTLADEHLDTILLEAAEWLNYKSNNPQLRIAV